MIKLTERLVDTLLDLRAGDKIAGSRFNKEVLDALLAEGFLSVEIHGSRKSYRLCRREGFEEFLSRLHEALGNLDNAKAFLEAGGDAARSAQAAVGGNSKLIQARSCPGFMVASLEPLECMLQGRGFVIRPLGGALNFIWDWRSFCIPGDVTVCGVENMENFRLLGRQKSLFDTIPARKLFVARYPQNGDLIKWLEGIPNRYVHFGDFDLAGISIFQTEFEPHLGDRSTFLIPDDIELRLAHGSRERYDAQWERFRTLRGHTPAVAALIALIHRYRRCYDQEGYIT